MKRSGLIWPLRRLSSYKHFATLSYSFNSIWDDWTYTKQKYLPIWKVTSSYRLCWDANMAFFYHLTLRKAILPRRRKSSLCAEENEENLMKQKGNKWNSQNSNRYLILFLDDCKWLRCKKPKRVPDAKIGAKTTRKVFMIIYFSRIRETTFL